MTGSDAALIRQTLAGDNAAFGALVTRYEQRVIGCCYRILGNREDAADAAQEAFVKAYHALESLDATRPMLPWLLRIAVNACKDILKAPARARWTALDEETPEREPETGPEQALLAKESLGAVERAVIDLPYDMRDAVALFYYGQLSVAEVAAATGSSAGTVKWRLYEARRRLREALEEVEVSDALR